MSSDNTMFEWIDAQASRMGALVREWADVNTSTYNVAGLATFAGLMKEAWAPLGGETVEIELPDEQTVDSLGRIVRSPLGKALSIRKRPQAPLRIFLCIHMDTVYPIDSSFQRCDPLADNTLRGPGVTDAKGGLAIMLVVAEAIERSALAEKIGWEALINPDEEIGSPGSSPLFELAAKRNHVGLLFEPAYGAGDLVSARSGSASFTAVIHGRSAHAGRDPKSGRNAIHAMASIIVALGRLGSDNITVNVGKVEGGGPVNVVPDLAICRFNVRVRTPDEQRSVTNAIEQIIAEAGTHDGIRVELHGGFHRPPKPLDDRTKRLLDGALACGKELGLTLGHCRSGGVSDGNQLAAAGLPNLDSLGPRGGRIHSSDEFLLLDSLTERAKLTTLLMLKLASGEIAI
ncbi:MAG TPA: hydrolase [Humisphaera sp.]|nr:hydrolase [Humisphaera sp.]